MREEKHKKAKVTLIIVIFISTFLLLDLCSLLVQQNHYISRLTYIFTTKSAPIVSAFRGNKKPTSVQDVLIIQNWMTFDYINHLFTLPVNYLQTVIEIQDKRYPRLTIAEYAADSRVHQNIILAEVQSAVRNYLLKNQ